MFVARIALDERAPQSSSLTLFYTLGPDEFAKFVIMPFAPPRLSTITDWPRSSLNLRDKWRAVMSVGPPAAKGTTTRTGAFGVHCA